MFEKYRIKTTWFIPGHSLETFPEECAMIRDSGHEMYGLTPRKEIGSHGLQTADERVMQRPPWLLS